MCDARINPALFNNKIVSIGRSRRLDLGIILGASSPYYVQMFKDQKTIVNDILRRLNIGPSSVLPSVMVYDRSPKVVLSFENALTRESAITSIQKIVNTGSDRNFENMLHKARDELFKVQNGARPGVPKTLLIFMDEEPGKESDLVDVLNKLKGDGVRIVIITQGKDIDKNKVKNNTPNTDAWFFPDDLDAAKKDIKSITGALFSGWYR